MSSFVKEELSLVIDSRIFHEGSDIAFTYERDRIIGEIFRIVPAKHNKPAMLILNKLELRIENSSKREYPTGLRAYIVDKIIDVAYVSVS